MRKQPLLPFALASLLVVGMSGCNWEALDADGDGTITLEEIDTDGDGSITRSDFFVALVNALANCTKRDTAPDPDTGSNASDPNGDADETPPTAPALSGSER